MTMMDLKQTISHDRAIYHTYLMGLSANLGTWHLLAWSATSWSQHAVHQSKLSTHKSYGSLGFRLPPCSSGYHKLGTYHAEPHIFTPS